MPRIKLVTDSSADIPEPLARQLGITVVPLSVVASALPVPSSPFSADLLRRGARQNIPAVQVAPPSIEEFTSTYRSLRDTCDGILSVHVSSKWSEVISNALIAREAFGPIGKGGPFPIMVADSASFTMGLGWIVLALARAASSEQLDLARLARMAARLSEQAHVAFFVEHIDYLVRGGPGARLIPQVDSLASAKPLLHLDEGQVTVYEKTRTRAKARDALYNFVEDFPKIGELAVFHTGAQNDVEHLLTRIGAIYQRERVLILQPGPAVSAWLGPEAVGVAVLEGEE